VWGDAVLTAHRDGYGRGERLRPYMNDILGTVRLAAGHAPDETIDVVA
jgi:hypothetical protein